MDEPPLGMPSRDYFLHDADSPDQRAYLAYMSAVARLMGANPDTVRTDMANVLKFETALANVSWKNKS